MQQHCADALHHQAIMSPEIVGLEVPKTIKDVFYGSLFVLHISYFTDSDLLDRPSVHANPPNFGLTTLHGSVRILPLAVW